MKALEEDFLVGSVLMDLSKALNCIPDDLLIEKLYAYVFSGKKCHLCLFISKTAETICQD